MWTKIFTVIRDAACLLIGGGLLIHEGLQMEPSPVLMVVYMVIVTSPGAFAARWLGQSNSTVDTVGPSSPPASSSSPSGPSS